MNKPLNRSLAPIAMSCALALSPVYAIEYDGNGDPIIDFAAHTAAAAQAKQEMAVGIIVKYRDSSNKSLANKTNNNAMLNMSAKAGIQLKHHRFTALKSQVANFNRPLRASEASKIARLIAQDPSVEYAEPNYILTAQVTPNDSRYNEQWHYFGTNGINAPAAWDITTGTGVNVAVLDTGHASHSDLNGNVIGGYDFISSSTTARDGGGRDSNPKDEGDWFSSGECGVNFSNNSSWHGTHVAGTIGAVTNNSKGVAGVAYGAKVVPVRVLGKCGGSTADIADAMIWSAGGSVSGVPSNPNPAKVLNLSLGGGNSCSSTSQAAINSARANGAVVVVAAGNSDKNLNVSPTNPASCNGVIAVAASDSNGNRSVWSSTQKSSYGSAIDITAPGSNILSTLNSGTTTQSTESYAKYGGTSMATPHVAGVAALMFAVNPNLTPDQVEQMIKSSAKPFPSGSTCNTSICGAGLLNAQAAVQAAQGNGGGTPPPAGDDTLTKGVAKTGLSGAQGSETFFTIDVPAGATNLTFTMSGGTGDADLYTRFGQKPGTSSGSYDCRPYRTGNAEVCTVAAPNAGTYHVMVRAYSAYSGVSLVADYTEASTNPPGDTATETVTNNTNYTIRDNSTVNSPVTVSGRTGSLNNVEVKVDIKHTYIGDLIVTLVAPDGKSVVLHNRSGGSANNILETYTKGASAVTNSGNGEWKLKVEDKAGGDTGYIDSWTLTFK